MLLYFRYNIPYSKKNMYICQMLLINDDKYHVNG